MKEFYEGMHSTVIANRDEIDPFIVDNGVRQCCSLTPMLFTMFRSAVLKVSEADETNRVSL